MHLRTLEIFCAVANQRSFSKAAAAHGLTQSAVSQTIGHLEEHLGTQLIDRSTRPLALTDAGQTYLEGLQPILRTLEQLEQEVRGIGQRLSGRITIGAIYSVGLSYMPEAIEAFRRLHPEVEVRTEFGSSERVVEMTLAGIIDLGLVSFPTVNKKLRMTPWLEEPMRLVCSDRHPLAKQTEVKLSELQGIEMVGFNPELKLRREIDANLARAGIAVDVSMKFDNADSMVRAIQAHRGIGIVPESAVHRETANGSLRVIACRELRMNRPLGIIYPRSPKLSRPAAEFGSLLLGRPLEAAKRTGSGSSKLTAETTPQLKGTGVSVVA